MIDEKELEALRHTEYNGDPTVTAMMDTLDGLFRENKGLKAVARAAEKFIYGEPIPYFPHKRKEELREALNALAHIDTHPP